MATSLRYPMGHTFLDNSGNPLASGTVHYYEVNTTTDEPIYSDAAGLTALPNPITLNSAGRAVDGSSNLVAIYLSDAGATDYKEVVKDSGGTTLWTDDNIPQPVDPTASLTDTAKPRIQWSTDTDTSVSLTAGNLGGGRLADSSSNDITYAPIAASTAGNGNGYLIKKTSGSNTVTFDPDGSETVDGGSTFAWTTGNASYWFISDGANWRVALDRGDVPVGSIVAWTTSAAPAGWLECDGSAISRTTYAGLFAVISDDYGNGDGSTTFNLPDLRGEFIRGFDNTAGTDPDAASRTDRGDGTTGDDVGTKQASAFALHGHPFRTTTGTTPNANVLGGISTDEDGTTANQTAFTGTPSDSAGEQIGGSGASTETRPTNVGMMWIIKV